MLSVLVPDFALGHCTALGLPDAPIGLWMARI